MWTVRINDFTSLYPIWLTVRHSWSWGGKEEGKTHHENRISKHKFKCGISFNMKKHSAVLNAVFNDTFTRSAYNWDKVLLSSPSSSRFGDWSRRRGAKEKTRNGSVQFSWVNGSIFFFHLAGISLIETRSKWSRSQWEPSRSNLSSISVCISTE